MPEPRPDEIQPFFEFFNEIGILEQLSRAQFEARLPDGVLVSHFAVLNHLIRVADGRTPVQIARAFQTPKNTLTHTLSQLEVRGWINMRPNPDDKRSKQVWLTQQGREFRDAAIADVAADFHMLVPEISSEEVAAALPFLRKLRQVLDARRD